MREKTSNIIRIDYSIDGVKAKIESKLDELVSETRNQLSASHKHSISRFFNGLSDKPKPKKLKLEDFRSIKQNKSKIITNELEKHKVRAWTP